jgi:hypothetical protein
MPILLPFGVVSLVDPPMHSRKKPDDGSAIVAAFRACTFNLIADILEADAEVRSYDVAVFVSILS